MVEVQDSFEACSLGAQREIKFDAKIKLCEYVNA